MSQYLTKWIKQDEMCDVVSAGSQIIIIFSNLSSCGGSTVNRHSLPVFLHCGCDSPQTIILSWGCSCISSLLQPQLTGDKLLALRPSGLMGGRHTWSTELTHGGSSGLVVHAAETATFRHTPGRWAGPAVSLLGCVVDLYVGRALGQVFAVMAQAILSNLDGVEVALRAPLGG